MNRGITIILVFGFALSAQAQTSNDNKRLKQALERFPAADTNKDGVLTLDEAKAFKQKHAKKNAAAANAKGAKAPEGSERVTYKKVGDVELPLYIYKPAGHKPAAKAPAIVFFFGGGWKSGSPSQFEHQCKHLASRGMVAITVEYRVWTRHKANVEDCIEDAKSAMRWVRGNAQKLGIDPNRIAAGGGSAGGHLAACTALMDEFNAKSDNNHVSPKPNALVLFNPFMGVADTKKFTSDASERLHIKGAPEKILPMTYAATKQPPCIMFFGTADKLLEGAQLYQKESLATKNSCKIVTYQGQGHGFFNYQRNGGKHYKLTLTETDNFLAGLGWLAKIGTP